MFARPMQFLGTETAVVLELLHEVLPFMILPIAGVLQRIDPALREAASAWERRRSPPSSGSPCR